MVSDLEKRIDAIEKRNSIVEQDKAWETSIQRRAIITILTYFLVVLYLFLTGADKIFLTAFVPALGYFLSTLVLKTFKAKYYSRRK